MPYFTPNEHSLLGSLFAGRQTALSRVQAVSFSPPCGLGGAGCPSSINARCLSIFCLANVPPALGGCKMRHEKQRRGKASSSSAYVCAGFPCLHLEGRAVRALGSVICSVAPVRASPTKISPSGDGARVQEGEKAAMLCKPFPMAAYPLPAMWQCWRCLSAFFQEAGTSPDPAPQGSRGFCWWLRGGRKASTQTIQGGGWGVCLSAFN